MEVEKVTSDINKDYLNFCIKRNGKTQKYLADYLGISLSSLQAKMRGLNRWLLNDIRKVKECLALSDEEVIHIFRI